MIKILIADDHSVVREGLKQIVAETADIVVADEAENGLEVLEKVRKKNYDVVILDITMPGLSGLDLLKQVSSEKPDLRLMILSMHPEEQYAIRALRAGAKGYLTKESAPNELITAIRRISQGRKYVSSTLAERLAHTLEIKYEKLPHEILSDREFEVMGMISKGKATKEIADELHLSVKTVSTYRTRILEKMEMKTTIELIRYAFKHGLAG